MKLDLKVMNANKKLPPRMTMKSWENSKADVELDKMADVELDKMTGFPEGSNQDNYMDRAVVNAHAQALKLGQLKKPTTYDKKGTVSSLSAEPDENGLDKE
jgi:hypothetical protein